MWLVATVLDSPALGDKIQLCTGHQNPHLQYEIDNKNLLYQKKIKYNSKKKKIDLSLKELG